MRIFGLMKTPMSQTSSSTFLSLGATLLLCYTKPLLNSIIPPVTKANILHLLLQQPRLQRQNWWQLTLKHLKYSQHHNLQQQHPTSPVATMPAIDHAQVKFCMAAEILRGISENTFTVPPSSPIIPPSTHAHTPPTSLQQQYGNFSYHQQRWRH